MAKGVNKVILIGNLGNDPVVHSFSNGGIMTNISVATSESWKDKQTGEQKERTEWHRVSFRSRLAEIARDYLKKGSKVYIEGSLRTSKYQDKQTGQDRYSVDIIANEMQMLDSRGASDSSVDQGGDSRQPQALTPHTLTPHTLTPHTLTPQAQPANAVPAGGFDSFDDDIPF